MKSSTCQDLGATAATAVPTAGCCPTGWLRMNASTPAMAVAPADTPTVFKLAPELLADAAPFAAALMAAPSNPAKKSFMV